MKPLDLLRMTTAAGIVALGAAMPALANGDHESGEEATNHGPKVTQLLMPIMNSRRGMDLFIEKGCYTCHAVNGVGGHDAAALDAHNMEPYMNPFDLAAKMWIMASIMIPAQEEALGSQVEFTGDELADIIAFLHDDEQQHQFHEGLLSEEQMMAMEHEHGGASGEEAHGEEIGHTHADDDPDHEEGDGHSD